MHLKSVVLCAILSSFLGENLSYLLDKTTTQSECENICAASTGQADFNPETKICKCLLSKQLDDVDMAVLHKNAKLIIDAPKKPFTLKNKMTKRETVETTTPPEESVSEITETTDVPMTTTEKENDNNETDPIIGQATPPRRNPQRVNPRKLREPRPISIEQQRVITQQIIDHVNHLGQLSDQRLRSLEIDAIKNNLRQLTNTVLAPQPRSRLRNVVEERRRPRPRLLQSRIVAAPFPNFNENSTEKSEDTESAVKEIFHGKRRHEIVTQDPALIDE